MRCLEREAAGNIGAFADTPGHLRLDNRTGFANDRAIIGHLVRAGGDGKRSGAFALRKNCWRPKHMWRGVVSPDELRLIEGVLDKAAAELRIEPGSQAHENLASFVLTMFQTVKDPDELLTITLRGERFGRSRLNS
jgi:hypothetical protein